VQYSGSKKKKKYWVPENRNGHLQSLERSSTICFLNIVLYECFHLLYESINIYSVKHFFIKVLLY